MESLLERAALLERAEEARLDRLLEGSRAIRVLHRISSAAVIVLVYGHEVLLLRILRGLEHALHAGVSLTLLHTSIGTAFHDLAMFALNL